MQPPFHCKKDVPFVSNSSIIARTFDGCGTRSKKKKNLFAALLFCRGPIRGYAQQLVERVLPPSQAYYRNDYQTYLRVCIKYTIFLLCVIERFFYISKTLNQWKNRDQKFDAVVYYWLYKEVFVLLQNSLSLFLLCCVCVLLLWRFLPSFLPFKTDSTKRN